MRQLEDIIVNGVRLHVQDGMICRRVWRGPFKSELGPILLLFDYPMAWLKNGRIVWGRPIMRIEDELCYCLECRQNKEAVQPERSPYMTDVDMPALAAARLQGNL